MLRLPHQMFPSFDVPVLFCSFFSWFFHRAMHAPLKHTGLSSPGRTFASRTTQVRDCSATKLEIQPWSLFRAPSHSFSWHPTMPSTHRKWVRFCRFAFAWDVQLQLLLDEFKRARARWKQMHFLLSVYQAKHKKTDDFGNCFRYEAVIEINAIRCP